MTTNCPVIDDGYRDEEIPDRAVPDVNCLPDPSQADVSASEFGGKRSDSVAVTSQDQHNQNEIPYEAAPDRFTAVLGALGELVGSNQLEDDAPKVFPDHYLSIEEKAAKDSMDAAGEAENMVHADFNNSFGDLYDDKDIN